MAIPNLALRAQVLAWKLETVNRPEADDLALVLREYISAFDTWAVSPPGEYEERETRTAFLARVEEALALLHKYGSLM